MLRSSLRGSAAVCLFSLASALLLPACDCAGPTGVADGGDVGSLPDVRFDGGGADTPRDAFPDTDPRDVGGGCVPRSETCDGTDEDCDGLIDQSVVESCGTDEGECVAGTRMCAMGMFGACTGEALPSVETCGDGLDEDCDAMIDEGCACTNGTTQPCGSLVGECAQGTQTCASSMWGACVGEVGPAIETCDGLDNDCDGMDDELFTDLGMTCDGGDADSCNEGMRVCASGGAGTTCNDATGDSAEVCGNSMDDDCDGATDEGCVCTDGMTQSCGIDVGECAFGMQTCTGGAWGACSGGTGPVSELCNTLDDDCDATSDEGFVTGGVCDGADADLCTEGMLACDVMGGVSCSDATGDSAETCNAMDDDCDGTLDEGFMLGVACDGPDADMCPEGANVCNGTGGVSCSDATGDSVETCNGMDDDCDGMTDEGNPGGGVACGGADVGACVARTACVMGAIVCRGTFVSPTGTATATGSRTDPLPSIASAITNAGILGGGADVCVCAPTVAVATFTENVTMVEGTSVLGAYDCATWTRAAPRTTAIQDTDDDGVTFGAGITAITALEQMTVVGLNRAGAGVTTSAITITSSSPTLTTVTARAGNASTAVALRVVETAGSTAAPSVSGGSYTASGVAGGTSIGAWLEASSPNFRMVQIGGFSSGIAGGVPTTAYGVRCVDCAGTSFTGGNVTGGGATDTGYGFHGTGDLSGVMSNMTSFAGGTSTATNSRTTGIRLDTCTGAPTFTGGFTFGGNGIGGLVMGATRTAIHTTGLACAPVIDGGNHVGCEGDVNCYGIDADTGSAIVVRNARVTGATGFGEVGIGMRCLTNACASITGNTIAARNMSRSALVGIGLEIDGASPRVDDNTITGPDGSLAVPSLSTRYFALYLRQTSSVLTNNLIFAGTHSQPQSVVRYDQTPAGPALIAPTLHSNTIEYVSCTTCGNRIGLEIVGTPGAAITPMGIVRNTIIRHVGIGGVTRPVEERNAQSDLQFFENNVLFDPGATGGAVYLDEGTTGRATAMALNMLTDGTSAANQIFDCALTAAWRIPASAPNGGTGCRNTGTATGAPATDFDGQTRPREMVFDIGADEFVP